MPFPFQIFQSIPFSTDKKKKKKKKKKKDEFGQHAQVCKVEGAAVHRHDTIRDSLVPDLKQYATSVKLEQFIYELAQLDEDTGETKEARMDIVADMPQLRAMLDVRCYLSTLSGGWRSARAHEMEKHQRYVTHCNGRRCSNMVLFAAVVNTYGYVGKEFQEFCAVIDEKGRKKNRGRTLIQLLSLLGVYANAEKVLLAHAPSKKRSQREDVIAAIAAKDAAAAGPAPADAALAHESGRVVAAQSHKKVNRTAKKRPELKDPVPPVGGGTLTHFRCKECEFTISRPVYYKNWARHIKDYHKNDDAGDDDGDVGVDQPEAADAAAGATADLLVEDDGDARPSAAMPPARPAAPARGLPAPAGAAQHASRDHPDDVAAMLAARNAGRQPIRALPDSGSNGSPPAGAAAGAAAEQAAKPKKRSEPKNAEPPAAAPKRGRRNSAGDEGAQIAKPKSKVARQNS